MTNIENEFKKIKLKKYQCEKGNRFFDPIRNCFVHITPEEIVRQKMLKYLINKMNVPKENIYIEDHLSHYGVNDANGRIDISLLTNDGKSLAVIECKEERKAIISMQVYEQAIKYAAAIGAPYVILVNGIDIQFFHLDTDSNTYININGVLSYNEMLQEKFEEYAEQGVFERLKYSDYYNIEFLKNFEWYHQKIGEDTNEILIPFIINLDDCLLDYTHKMTNTSCDYLEITEDLGVQYRTYGDRSGGNFGSGFYRTLLVNDKRKNTQFIIGFTIITTGKVFHDPIYGTSDGKSVLVIIRNDGDFDEMSVQINLNKFVKIDSKKASITHNGIVTRKGAKKSDLINYISTKASHLISKDTISFGTLNFSKNLYMDSKDVTDCFTKMIEYSIFRDEYKRNL